MMKLALKIVIGVAIAGGVAPAFADDADLHKPAKGAKVGVHDGGTHAAAPKALGGAGAGIAAGIFGAAIGATVVDALAHANAAAPPPGCHFEDQPLFDASGQQVSSHRVRVCN
jgi:hypothetical protein